MLLLLNFLTQQIILVLTGGDCFHYDDMEAHNILKDQVI